MSRLLPQLADITTMLTPQGSRDIFNKAIAKLSQTGIHWKVAMRLPISVEVSGQIGGSLPSLGFDLTQLFLSLGRLLRTCDSQLVLLIDEVQFMPRDELAALCEAMPALEQHVVKRRNK